LVEFVACLHAFKSDCITYTRFTSPFCFADPFVLHVEVSVQVNTTRATLLSN